jgi:cytochrome P450 / NADPH-cytochrome P450 reductase
MLKNPETLYAAQKEVDRVVGDQRIAPKHLKELKYINAVLRETLRLTPTAPAFSRTVRPENKDPHPTIGGGKYPMPEQSGILCLLGSIQTDPKVFGQDSKEFNPERMLDGNFEKLPKNAWKVSTFHVVCGELRSNWCNSHSVQALEHALVVLLHGKKHY